MLQKQWPCYVASRPSAPNFDLGVTDKYSGETVAWVTAADRAMIDQAIGAAEASFPEVRKMPAYARQAVLQHCVRRFGERAEELAMALCIEAGKPIRDARGEVTRLIDTFRYAAEESVRQDGEVLELAIS
ncbi:MAG TPA: aldehyde dehydrogenase family protein, partial [Myxococcota bacterium]|nr:aldehyde dehydrogenase family protein [Myxococcota bacterium]